MREGAHSRREFKGADLETGLRLNRTTQEHDTLIAPDEGFRLASSGYEMTINGSRLNQREGRTAQAVVRALLVRGQPHNRAQHRANGFDQGAVARLRRRHDADHAVRQARNLESNGDAHLTGTGMLRWNAQLRFEAAGRDTKRIAPGSNISQRPRSPTSRGTRQKGSTVLCSPPGLGNKCETDACSLWPDGGTGSLTPCFKVAA